MVNNNNLEPQNPPHLVGNPSTNNEESVVVKDITNQEEAEGERSIMMAEAIEHMK